MWLRFEEPHSPGTGVGNRLAFSQRTELKSINTSFTADVLLFFFQLAVLYTAFENDLGTKNFNQAVLRPQLMG